MVGSVDRNAHGQAEVDSAHDQADQAAEGNGHTQSVVEHWVQLVVQPCLEARFVYSSAAQSAQQAAEADNTHDQASDTVHTPRDHNSVPSEAASQGNTADSVLDWVQS